MCSARAVSKRVHVSFQLCRVDQASRRATVQRVFPEGFLEDSGKHGKKGKYNSPLANTAVQYALVYLVLQVMEDSRRSTTIGEHSLPPNTFI